jgi:hypothetical protein
MCTDEYHEFILRIKNQKKLQRVRWFRLPNSPLDPYRAIADVRTQEIAKQHLLFGCAQRGQQRRIPRDCTYPISGETAKQQPLPGEGLNYYGTSSGKRPAVRYRQIHPPQCEQRE